MKSILKGFVRALALTAALVACALAGAQPGVSDTEIRFGSSLVLSGPSAQLGQEMAAGMEAYFHHVNATGGIDGRRLRLILRDDGYEPARAAANTTALIRQDGVFALMGYVGTPTTNAAVPILTEAGVPLVGAFTGAQSLREPFNRYVYNVRASYEAEGVPLAKQLAVYGKVALFIQEDAYGAAVKDAMIKGLAKYGLSPVVVATIKRNAIDAASINKAADLIAQSGASAIAVGSVYAPVGALMAALHERKSYPVIASVSFIGTSALLERMGATAAGFGISQVVPSPYSESSPLMRQLHADVEAWHDELVRRAQNATTSQEKAELLTQAKYAVPSYGVVEGYITGMVGVEGLHRCGEKLSRQRYVDALDHLGTFDMRGYKVTFTPQDHSGSTFVEITLVDRTGTTVLR